MSAQVERETGKREEEKAGDRECIGTADDVTPL